MTLALAAALFGMCLMPILLVAYANGFVENILRLVCLFR